MSAKELLHIADALDCFWNAAIGQARNSQDSTAIGTAGAIAQGIAAMASRLREHGLQSRIEEIEAEQAAQEPSAECWRKAVEESFLVRQFRPSLAWIEQRARELAQEGK